MSTVLKDSPISMLSGLSSLTDDDLFLVSDKKQDGSYSSNKISYLDLTNSLSSSLSNSLASVKLVIW